MDKVQLQPGIYTNIFPVIPPDKPVTMMRITRTSSEDLLAMRDEIDKLKVQVAVYAHNKYVYGYGSDAVKILIDKGFEKNELNLMEIPSLAARIILEGIVALALSKDFWQRRRSPLKIISPRTQIFYPEPKGITRQGNVFVYSGYDLRCAYYPAVESLGLVVDVIWAYRDKDGISLNMEQMRAKNAIPEALSIQEEFLRGTNRLNLQIAQIRMHNYLLPFVQEIQTISLSCGGQACIETIPFPVILGR